MDEKMVQFKTELNKMLIEMDSEDVYMQLKFKQHKKK